MNEQADQNERADSDSLQCVCECIRCQNEFEAWEDQMIPKCEHGNDMLIGGCKECEKEALSAVASNDVVMGVAAQAYQVIGAMGLSDFKPREGEVERALDYFGGIANGDIKPDEGFLPWG